MKHLMLMATVEYIGHFRRSDVTLCNRLTSGYGSSSRPRAKSMPSPRSWTHCRHRRTTLAANSKGALALCPCCKPVAMASSSIPACDHGPVHPSAGSQGERVRVILRRALCHGTAADAVVLHYGAVSETKGHRIRCAEHGQHHQPNLRDLCSVIVCKESSDHLVASTTSSRPLVKVSFRAPWHMRDEELHCFTLAKVSIGSMRVRIDPSKLKRHT